MRAEAEPGQARQHLGEELPACPLSGLLQASVREDETLVQGARGRRCVSL